MGMNLDSGGKKKGVTPEMNVTPLVDVVLVLLIIFMVITPLLSKNFWVHTPKQEKEEIEKPELAEDPNPPLVLRVSKENTVAVNGADVPIAELPERLKRMFAAREDHIVFFDAADEVEYGFAVQVMDKAREGGAVTIAALTTMLGATDGTGETPAAPATVAN
jgi:biopolymer transport protein ExbD/biopolymer transport protein TolR